MLLLLSPCCCLHLLSLLLAPACVHTVNVRLPCTLLHGPTAMVSVPAAVAKHVILLLGPIALLLRLVCLTVDLLLRPVTLLRSVALLLRPVNHLWLC